MKTIVILSIAICFCSCLNINNERLNNALDLAGENRGELEAVLAHYADDHQKLEAARFLIRSMPRHFSHDTTQLWKYRPFLLQLDSLRKVEKEQGFSAIDSIDKVWDAFLSSNSLHADIYSTVNRDIKSVSANYLISNIDAAYKIWSESVYRDSVSVEVFMQELLPYRKEDRYVIEDWRNHFLTHYGAYLHKGYSIHQLIDTLMMRIDDQKVSGVSISSYPYLCILDYQLGKMSHCESRCWYNSLLLSALGVPCAIDYVPVWGNRNGAHSWNALIYGGKTYAFEGIGGIKGKWKSGKVYNNVWVDEYWMKSRLPKVLRYSYEPITTGPSISRNSNKGNTPPSFLRSTYRDVSDEYFTTSDISIPILNLNKEEYHSDEYVYLFVFNNDRWQAAFWGKIADGAGFFEKMGRDVVYLPGFYAGGYVIPFNDPFILHDDGSIRYLRPQNSQSAVVLDRKYYERPDVMFWRKWNEGAYIEVADNPRFTSSRKIFEIPSCNSYHTIWQLPEAVESRYVRYVFPEKKDVLAELTFHTDGDSLLSGELLFSNPSMEKELLKSFDGNTLTFTNLLPHKESESWVGVDFGKKKRLMSVGLSPRNDDNNVMKGNEYELFYWDGEWISLGKKLASHNHIKYMHVPDNALLMLQCTAGGRENRIFTWEKNIQKWW